MLPRFVFIGGTRRGLRLFQKLVEAGNTPQRLFILKEDDHELIQIHKEFQELADANGIPSTVTKKISDKQIDELLKDEFDFAIVCGWRSIIDTRLNKAFRFGMYAAHDSLLPKYRGFAPLNWAIINGEKETGVTVFKIVEGEVDSGDIVEQEKVLIGEHENAEEVFNKVVDATIKAFESFFRNFTQNKVKFTQQDETQATYTCKRTPADGKVNWTKPYKKVYDLIRALAPPYPGAYCYFNSKRYIIHSATLPVNQKKYVENIPGRVLKITDNGVEVMCGEGSVIITKWSEEGASEPASPSSVVKSITSTLE